MYINFLYINWLTASSASCILIEIVFCVALSNYLNESAGANLWRGVVGPIGYHTSCAFHLIKDCNFLFRNRKVLYYEYLYLYLYVSVVWWFKFIDQVTVNCENGMQIYWHFKCVFSFWMPYAHTYLMINKLILQQYRTKSGV